METRIVYVATCFPNCGIDQLSLRQKLGALVQSILEDDLVAEVLACHQNYREEEVCGWLRYTKILASPAKDVMTSTMLTVTISTHTKEISRAVTRAHQRLMLKSAHLNDIDLSISV